MGKIIEFYNDDDTQLTEYEIQILKEAENTPDVTGKHSDAVLAKIKQDELRISNGLEPKYDMKTLVAESLIAAVLDAEEEVL